MLRGRLRSTTYLYEDPDHPDRITSTVEAPAFTEDDRALLLALALYEDGGCPGCGQPKEHAWHSELDGWYEATSWVCHGCTELEGRQKAYSTLTVRDGIDADWLNRLPPLDIGVNTTPPDDTPS